VRLFLALDLGDEITGALGRSIDEARLEAPKARWVEASNIHLTLVFLGAVPDERVAEVTSAMQRSAARHAPFELGVAGAGSFGSSRHPRVLFCALDGDVERLVALQADLSRELGSVGYEPEKRAYAPHVTLARARDPKGDAALARCVEALHETAFGRVSIGEIVLYRSDLSPRGARYTPLERVPLAKRGPRGPEIPD
jgi:RNA 2',3'-cyclic 3'-phosphodiesterase